MKENIPFSGDVMHMQRTEGIQVMYDIAILGGGPAGLSAAINARVRNKTVAVISNACQDNPLYRSGHVPNYPALPDISGAELLERMHAQAVGLGAEWIEKRLIAAMYVGKSWMLSAAETVLESRVLILAGGIIRGEKFPGEQQWMGRGVSYCATCDGMLYRKKRVVVYGETESAEQEANYLKEIGCIVVYLSRRPEQGKLVGTIPFIRIKTLELGGDTVLTHVLADGEKIACDGVFLLRASVAPMDLIPGLAIQDGHIRVSPRMEPNFPALYAAGDCTGQPYQIAKAVGEGQVAALAAVSWLDRRPE